MKQQHHIWNAKQACLWPALLYSCLEDRLVTAEDVIALYGCWADEALMARLVTPVQTEEAVGGEDKELHSRHDHVHQDV